MNRDDILSLPSMPAASPSYPRGPFRFVDREYFIVAYETDGDALRQAVPEPLVPDPQAVVYYEWIRMPDSSGFGDYTESGVVIPCTYKGEPCNFVAQMYLDDDPPIAAGREIWGFPKKYAHPALKVNSDTLTGTLDYAGERVAMGSMVYKHESMARDLDKTLASLTKLQVNLKLIPDVDGRPAIAQLVAYNLTDITVKGSWTGAARLQLIPHVNAPVADFPVRRIIGGRHFVADLSLPYGRVLHDYLSE
ncbi:MAG TPA: acetoacetate decarboxylase [Dongiaceae bacterium]|jgi:acetoacetate decarboxylase|nr:acetoacetate decarboxylase [Dongiaceae bacterium]